MTEYDSQRALVTLAVARAVIGTVVRAPRPSLELGSPILIAQSAVTVSRVHDLSALYLPLYIYLVFGLRFHPSSSS